MEDYRARLKQIEEQAWKDEQSLLELYLEYNPEQQRALREKERIKRVELHTGNAKRFLDSIDAEIERQKVNLLHARFPLLSSTLESEKLRGEAQVSNAYLISDRFPVEVMKANVELGRVDFVSACVDRWQEITPSGPEEDGNKRMMARVIENARERFGITKIEADLKDLGKVKEQADILRKKLVANLTLRPKTMQDRVWVEQKLAEMR